jgi:hypothetical protein
MPSKTLNFDILEWPQIQRSKRYPATTADGAIPHEIFLGRKLANTFQECANDFLVLATPRRSVSISMLLARVGVNACYKARLCQREMAGGWGGEPRRAGSHQPPP